MVQRSEPGEGPRVFTAPGEFRAALDAARARGEGVGLVPTMGALHEGHVALVHEARRRVGVDGFIAVTIFVNPTQFGPNEDLARYPRTLEADLARCHDAGVDAVFAPSAEAMYPPGDQTRVRVGALAEPFCGPFRPGHFEGVATVVAKLFALAGACTAVFGRKDYQQLRVITAMTRDLFLPVEVVGLATVRERDGLAMSSRNRYLSPEHREKAAVIPRELGAAVRAWQAGERDADAIAAKVRASFEKTFDSVDYVEIRDAETLGPVPQGATRAVLACAVRNGAARLIDNVVLGEDPPPV